MSDPGSIVGAVSLLLQILQGLRKYYFDYRGFSKDIFNIITHISRAEAILSVLRTPIEHLWRDDEELSIEVHKCMKSCEEACKKLEHQLRRCNKCHEQQKEVLLWAKMLYPFRKTTLEDLQKQLDRLFNDLQLFMHALNLDASIIFHHQTMSQASTTYDDTKRIHDRQVYQTELLEEILLQSERRYQQIGNLALDVIKLLEDRHHRLPNPSALKPACDQYLGIIQTTQKHVSKATNKYVCCTPVSCCSCSNLSRRGRSASSKRWGCFTWSKQSDHPPPCPLSTVAYQTRSALARLRFCYHGLGYLIEASLTWSRSSLTPYLAFRCIVPRHSPLFAVVDAYSRLISEPEVDDVGSSVLLERNVEATLLTLRAIHTLIQDGRGSVRDVDLEGNTLAHVLLHSLGTAVQREPHAIHFRTFSDVLLYSIRLLHDLGCDINEQNDLGCTPVGSLVIGSTTPVPPSIPEMRSMIDSLPWTTVFGCFELSTDFLTRQYRNFYHRESGESMLWVEVYSQLKTDLESGPYCLDGPLIRAVTLQKEDQVLKILQAPEHIVQRENTDFSIWRTLSWPRGFELLLPYGFMDNEEYPEVLKAAFHCGYTTVVDKLLQLPQFDHTMWPAAVDSGDNRFMQLVASKLYSRHCESSATALFMPGSLIVPDPEYCAQLYMPKRSVPPGKTNMTVEAARILHEAGFPYADINHAEQGTPFWYLATTSTLPLYEYSRLMTWLSSKGADVTAAHPTWATMPLHHIAKTITLLSLHHENISSSAESLHLERLERFANNSVTISTLDDEKVPEFVCSIFGSPESDHCRCLCAPSGCNVVSSALKTQPIRNNSEPLPPMKRLQEVWKVLKRLLPSERLLETSVCDSIIRVSTFEAMQLSHTCHCCDIENLSPENMSHDYVDDIRYAEQHDIRTFEALLEEFNETWCMFDGGIMDFMDGLWTTRMTAFLEEGDKIISKKELDDMRAIGVWVHTCELPVSEVSEASYDLAWFRDKVDNILSGIV